MTRRVSVVAAVREAWRVWVGWPVEICAPLLLLNVTMWGIQQTSHVLLSKGLYSFFQLLLSVVCLLVQELLAVIVLRVGYLRSSGHLLPVEWGTVLGWKGLRGTVGALYLRYVLWTTLSFLVIGLTWFFGLIAWFIVHHHVPKGSGAAHHTTLIWVFFTSWILANYLLLSRYQFVLPLVGIEGEVRQNVIRDGVRLATGCWGAVVGVAFLEDCLLILPVWAVLHFLKPVLEPIHFAYGGLELVTTVLSSLAAAWFVLMKLDLAQQALRVRDAGVNS